MGDSTSKGEETSRTTLSPMNTTSLPNKTASPLLQNAKSANHNINIIVPVVVIFIGVLVVAAVIIW
jgi:hypothetical protein